MTADATAWNPQRHALTTLDEIRRAREALPEAVRLTPLLPLARDAAEIGEERLFLKCECLQVTGAYKVRAAFHVLHEMPAAQRARGIVLTSSGNFAQAFAYAGRLTGVPVVVVMLDRTSAYKVEQTRAHGAEVVFCGTDAAERQPAVRRVAAERGMTAIDTWEERAIPAGHGTIGLEILEQCPQVEQVLVPVSSGGVAAGIAAAVKLSRPEVRVIGVQPERANAAWESRRAGHPVAIGHWDSIADGLSAVRPGEFPFAHLERFVDDIVLISEAELAQAFRVLLMRAKLLSEPAGAVASAAFLAGRVDQGLRTVSVVTGGNLTEEVLGRLLQMGR